MTNPREILAEYGLLPKKALGQNFLHDPNAVEKIASIGAQSVDEAVLEIGPGVGALTEALAKRARRVVAVELDERLKPILDERLKPYANVEIVYGNILKQDPAVVMGADAGNYVVAANVPYYITSAILRHFLEASARPRRLTIMMQMEVAEKLIAKPGDMSLLTVSVQYYAQAQIVVKFPPAVFYPRPDVSSAVVRLDVHAQPPVDAPVAAFFRVAKAGFSQKRKQLKNSLGSGLHISAAEAGELCVTAGIDPQRRPETLTLAEWAALARGWMGRQR
ncbi:MAG: ribosomal RNA small subunit methyltransferase A [Anaerolineae bacterium]|nr:ribosomal RNA small subunit methyltransferase A [Anaerolineae bacterium]